MSFLDLLLMLAIIGLPAAWAMMRKRRGKSHILGKPLER